MERRRPGARDEGAHRPLHRRVLPAQRHPIDSIRMDGLTRSLFVLKVGRIMRPTNPPDYPDDPVPEPAHRGRGALSNESSRYDSEKRIRTTDGWETEASPTPDEDDELP